MTHQRAKELLPVITAYSEGKKIQYQMRVNGKIDWFNIDVDLSSYDFVNSNILAWRIKPEPREFWLVSSAEQSAALTCSTRAQAEHFFECNKEAKQGLEIIHVREVLD